VRRTVRAFEKVGVAGVHIEDQLWPKRCGHLAGKTLVPRNEMIEKVRAAVDARRDQEFLIIARTDALVVEGFDAAIDRGIAYEEAGADMIFIEAPSTPNELCRMPAAFSVPTVYKMVSSGRTPPLSTAEISELGFRLVIYPNLPILAAIPAIRQVLAELQKRTSVAGLSVNLASFRGFFDNLGLSEV